MRTRPPASSSSPRSLELVDDRDRVDRLALRVERERRAVDLRVALAVEVARVEDLADGARSRRARASSRRAPTPRRRGSGAAPGRRWRGVATWAIARWLTGLDVVSQMVAPLSGKRLSFQGKQNICSHSFPGDSSDVPQAGLSRPQRWVDELRATSDPQFVASSTALWKELGHDLLQTRYCLGGRFGHRRRISASCRELCLRRLDGLGLLRRRRPRRPAALRPPAAARRPRAPPASSPRRDSSKTSIGTS